MQVVESLKMCISMRYFCRKYVTFDHPPPSPPPPPLQNPHRSSRHHLQPVHCLLLHTPAPLLANTSLQKKTPLPPPPLPSPPSPPLPLHQPEHLLQWTSAPAPHLVPHIIPTYILHNNTTITLHCADWAFHLSLHWSFTKFHGFISV